MRTCLGLCLLGFGLPEPEPGPGPEPEPGHGPVPAAPVLGPPHAHVLGLVPAGLRPAPEPRPLPSPWLRRPACLHPAPAVLTLWQHPPIRHARHLQGAPRW